jgi:hypothetical protein
MRATRLARVPGLMQGKHLVLIAPHPSPLSAHSGFFGCRHFSQANTFLEQKWQGRGSTGVFRRQDQRRSQHDQSLDIDSAGNGNAVRVALAVPAVQP